MAGEDPDYIAWLSERECCVDGCERRSGPPHHCKYFTGGSRRSHDHMAIPICPTHHEERHRLSGFFKGWTKKMWREWEQAAVSTYRTMYRILTEKDAF